MLVYVADLIIASADDSALRRFLDFIGGVLPVDDKGDLSWVLRMEVSRPSPGVLVLSQRRYALNLAEKYYPSYASAPPYDSPLDETITLDSTLSPDPGSDAHSAMHDKRSQYMRL